MTISTTATRISYTGNGVTTAFSFPYKFLVNDDLVVSVNGVLKTLITDYTVIGAGNDAGGTVTFGTAPVSGHSVLIMRVMEITQEVDYIAGDPFPAETHEEALDRLTMIAQEQQEQLSRSVRIPETDATSLDMTLPKMVDRVNTVLAFDASGEPTIGPDIATVGTVADNIANINAVAANSTNINTVAGNSTNINTVATNSTNVTTVAGISASVTSVASNSTNINTVAGSIASVVNVSNNIGSVNTVASISANVTTVAGVSANVTAVAGNATNINNVAANATNINTVASISSDIETVADNIVPIQNAEGYADDAAASAAAALAAAAGQFLDYTEVRYNLGTLGSTATLNIANGNYQEGVTGANNVTFTMPAAPPSGYTKSFTVAVKQGGTARTVTFTGVKWLSSLIAAKATASKWTVWTFFYSQTEGSWLSTGAIQEP